MLLRGVRGRRCWSACWFGWHCGGTVRNGLVPFEPRKHSKVPSVIVRSSASCCACSAGCPSHDRMGAAAGSTVRRQGSHCARPARRLIAWTTPISGSASANRRDRHLTDGQRLDVVECEVDEPGLDLADMRLVKIGEFGQALLAQALCLAKALDVRSENAARRPWVRPIHSNARTKAGLENL
jgi:hypothetical protein